jgi:hypothetical protein
MTAPPIPCVWRDGAFWPLRNFHNVAAAHYGEGEIVPLAPWEDRSTTSHNHEFAWLKDAWLSLPDALSDQYPNPESLRKWALIRAGFYDEQRIDAGTNAAALRVAAGVKSFPGEGFSAVVVRGPLVVIRRPKSQSRRAMDAKEFQASKQGVIDAVSDLIGVTPEALTRARAA